jgi:hypothetical protein
MARFHFRHLLTGRGLTLCCFILATGCKPAKPAKPARPTISGPLTQEMYVWQRVWTPSVVDGIRVAQERVAGFSVLAGEVVWKGSTPELVRPKLDYSLLAAQPRAPGLALRIGPFAGPFAETDSVAHQLVSLASTCLTDARKGGWEPCELQIDFDAATSKLSGYRIWLTAFQKAVAPLPVSFTALPDWLRAPELKAMAQQTGSFVLQVHGIDRARADEATPQLLHASSVQHWVAQADALDIPFRVALPTYRTAVGFNAARKIIGLDSEGPARAWPAGTKLLTYVSPAAEIAQLVREWTLERPANLTGLLWYRLPVAGEQRNWSWLTLTPVMQGRAPRQELSLAQQGENPIDLTLENKGEAEMAWPQEIRVTLPTGDSSILAGDALAGYELEFTPSVAAYATSATFRRKAEFSHQILPPASKKPLGWLRVRNETHPSPRELKIQINSPGS